MSDYIENVRKYRSNASEETVDKIVKHLGIALRNRDSSLVSCSDKSELERVRESWCKKKLASDKSDAELDEVINEVCVQMADEKSNKHRVTFYYLVADKLDKLVTL
ncbi:DUF2853 family protein [Parvularcula sp. IMCC14364]|uniref:DUF2853 family protein n=1 Tax=Parvularcula sp. IMCC14364 TaxID=3067902 RepID=UPI00274077C9|nr:DUF2853 family protein [Parvularcula sp. IMCC14364]